MDAFCSGDSGLGLLSSISIKLSPMCDNVYHRGFKPNNVMHQPVITKLLPIFCKLFTSDCDCKHNVTIMYVCRISSII